MQRYVFILTFLVLSSVITLWADQAAALTIKGIHLVESEEAGDGELSCGIDVSRCEVPGNRDSLKDALECYLGQPFSMDLIQDIRHAIATHYRCYNHPLMTTKIPEQDISNGILRIVIIEGRLGKIVSQGNCWFSDQHLSDYIQACSGDRIDSHNLLNDVAWMNRNPFRHTDLLLAPGDLDGTTNIVLVTRDRIPLRGYSGIDNTGTEFTGRTRWFLGFTGSFWKDHLLSYQWTFSENLHKFQSHTGQYVVPLSWRHIAMFYGGYAEVHPDIPHMHHNGRFSQASFRYQIPLTPFFCNSLKEFSLGYDFKSTNTNLVFLGENEPPIIDNTVNISQFMFSAAYAKEVEKHLFNGCLEVFWSPGAMLGSMSNGDFSELRKHAKNHYVYARFSMTDLYRLPYDFTFAARVRFQGSTQNLLPSEQFGLGGYDTVRGYEEREIVVDNAFCGNIELRTPPFICYRKENGSNVASMKPVSSSMN